MLHTIIAIVLTSLVCLCASQTPETTSECPYYVLYPGVNDTTQPHWCATCYTQTEVFQGHCRKPCPEFYQRASHTTCIPYVSRTYKLESGECPAGSYENEQGSCTVPEIVSLEYAISECKLDASSPYYYDQPYPDFEMMVVAEECK